MTVHLYGQPKQWPVETVSITLNHRKIAANEGDDCQTEGLAKVDIIECEVSFDGELNADRIKRLADIADRSPIHRTLTSETKIGTAVI